MKINVQTINQACKSAALAALCSASLLAAPTQPALALPPTIEAVIVESVEASYPILESLDGAFPSFTEKLGKFVLDIGQPKLGKAFSLGTDVFNSVPEDKVKDFAGVIKEAYSGLAPSSCTLVPLPAPATYQRFAAMATASVDAVKLKAFDTKWSPAISALAKTDSAICLPSEPNLEKLALAQAEIGRAFDYETVKSFFDYSAGAFKGEIRLTDDTLGLLASAKAQASDASYKDKGKFETAMKKLEAASKKEKEKNSAIRYKAKVAEEAAAKKELSGK